MCYSEINIIDHVSAEIIFVFINVEALYVWHNNKEEDHAYEVDWTSK